MALSGPFARSLLASAALLVVHQASADAPAAQPRIALIIGNSNYVHIAPGLKAPANDGPKLKAVLQQNGFDVDFETDLDIHHLSSTIKAFGDRLKASGPTTVAFFYYGGHAAQDDDSNNYLLPIDAYARTDVELRSEATHLQSLFDSMDDANNDVNIVILDACRDWLDGDNLPHLPKGLHDIGRHGSIFLALATSPGTVAKDGDETGSPYTKRLIADISTNGNKPLSSLFDDLDAEVYVDTDKTQFPEFLDGLARAPRWAIAPGSHPENVAVSPPPFPEALNQFSQSRSQKTARFHPR